MNAEEKRKYNRLFRRCYGVRASHTGKPRSYWDKSGKSKLVKLLTAAGLSLAKPTKEANV